MHFLWDQDGTIADWGFGFSNHPLRVSHPLIPAHADQRSFNLKEGLDPEHQMVVDEIMNGMSYGELLPIEGAVEAYHKTIEAGHIIHIVTSPWWTNKACLQDKSDWVEKYLGADARRNLVLTGDKTMVRGDYLVDDKPKITGEYRPIWDQIIYDQPYNQESLGMRLLTWDHWPEMLRSLEVLNAPFEPARR